MEFLPDQSIRLLRPNGRRSRCVTPLLWLIQWVDVAFYGGWERELDANEDSRPASSQGP